MSDRIKSSFDLSDRVAIITGSSKGIGESMARGLVEFGAKVVISSRKQEAVDKVVEELKADGFDAYGIACHVGDAEQVKNLVDKTIEKYGRLDIVINNAATNPIYGPLEDVEPSSFDKIVEINIKAPFTLCNYAFPHLKKSGNASIINIASVEGLKPSFGLGLYSMSKAALIMLTQNQAKEWTQYGIRSNSICPGLVKTKFSAALWQNEKLMNFMKSQLPAGRAAVPDEMAGLAVFLASDASSYCTGSSFTADGGFMMI